MQGVKILDKKDHAGGGRSLNVYLKDILALFDREKILTSRWRCWDLYYLIKIDGEWCSNKDKKMKLSGAELIKFSENVGQIIDGRFEARTEGAAKHPWLLIVFFDSSWSEIWSSKPWVIEKIKSHFREVSDISNNL
jgi:hypothetical protein